MSRAQLTIPDLVYIAAGIVTLAGLAPAFYAVLNEKAPELSTGGLLLWQMVIPGLVVTLLIIMFAIAVGGRG